MSKTVEGKQVSLFVDAEIIRSSSHKALLCTDCHADLRGTKIPHSPNVATVSCTRCHGKKSVDGMRDFILMCRFAESVHAQGASQSKQKTVNCRDCHGTHDIRPAHDPHSRVSRANIVATCSKCHLDPHVAAIHKQLDIKKIKQYMSSVHGKLTKSHGFLPAAVCTDCHGAHEILSSDNPRSLVNRANVSETCGKCHIKQLKAYNQSIHGEAITNGKLEAATCIDCHGTHLILSISDPSSMVFPTNVRVTCSNCHENPEIQRKYGIPTNRLSSYDASYHGIANRYGDVLVANCASCHGAHEIRQSNDPLSATNKKNLPKTCAKCHKNISP
ncbi:MAG: cytochrome c3 family protein, partial [Armatimonadota bacterium]|nr:cytochrome c3 family protein [Armatimonadota bacterium]